MPIFNDESKLHYAKINILREEGGNVVISEGLVDGDKLIVSALDYPVAGMKLALASDDLEEAEKDNDNLDEHVETQVVSTETKGE